jgi:uncharacterized RDD family membrane protein YckC
MDSLTPQSEIRVTEGLTTEGLLGRRYLARFIDSLVCGILLVLVWRSLSVLALAPGPALFFLYLTAVLAVFVGYGAAFEASPRQATPGKRITGLRAYNQSGDRLTLVQALGRNLAKEGPFILFGLLPQGPLIARAWLCVHLSVLHKRPVAQAIHDRIAKTWVAAPEGTTQLLLSSA